MSNVSMDDVLAASYTSVEDPLPMNQANAALLLVDVQDLATPEHLAKRAAESGLDASAVEAALADYAQRFYAAVANCESLLQAARGEIVITKTVSGAFTATNLDPVLRHMGIHWLIVTGFETDECIEATGRAALDLGYVALFAEDACTAYKADAHNAFMDKYASWSLTRSTDTLRGVLSSL